MRHLLSLAVSFCTAAGVLCLALGIACGRAYAEDDPLDPIDLQATVKSCACPTNTCAWDVNHGNCPSSGQQPPCPDNVFNCNNQCICKQVGEKEECSCQSNAP